MMSFTMYAPTAAVWEAVTSADGAAGANTPHAGAQTDNTAAEVSDLSSGGRSAALFGDREVDLACEVDGDIDLLAVSAQLSRERAVRAPTLAMHESATAAILEILHEIDPHGYLVEGCAPNAYFEPASWLGWNVHDVADGTTSDVLARVEAAFGWDRETPPTDLGAAYAEIADRIVTDVVRPFRKALDHPARECA